MLLKLRKILLGDLTGYKVVALVFITTFGSFTFLFFALISLFFEINKQTSSLNFIYFGCTFSIYIVLRLFPQLKHHINIFGLLVVLLFDLALISIWPFAHGSYGFTGYFFIVLVCLNVFLFEGKFLLLSMLVICISISGLLYYEFNNLGWVINIPGEVVSLKHSLEMFLSCLMAILAIFILNWMFKANFHLLLIQSEKKKKDFEEDLILSRILQKNYYSYSEELVNGYDFSSKMLPSSELGGDLFKLSRQDQCLRVFMADAQGHGVNAALSGILIASEWAKLNQIDSTPSKSLTELNKTIITEYDDNITFTAVVLELYSDKIIFSSAGHPNQYLINNSNLVPLINSGPPAGMFLESKYEDSIFNIEKTDKVFLFTDALIEESATNQDLEITWIENILRNNNCISELLIKLMLDKLASRLNQKSENLALKDDLLLIALGHDL